MKNANDSSKLQFRILTTEEDAPQLLKKVKERPGFVLEVNFFGWRLIKVVKWASTFYRHFSWTWQQSEVKMKGFDVCCHNFGTWSIIAILLKIPVSRIFDLCQNSMLKMLLQTRGRWLYLAQWVLTLDSRKRDFLKSANMLHFGNH